ncbi:MAG: SDR family oxidoreductase [Chloroflexi bacterium]|nr:SDR family oxidoreductase [Chloroflexota bacterium]
MGDLLKGKVAIVTGSGRGVGRGEALALAAEGAKVVVNDLGGETEGGGASKRPADEVVAEIKKKGGQAVANYDSVADFKAAGRIIQTALDSFGRLDILVNNAGILRDNPIWDMTEEDFDIVVAVHLKGTFNTCHHAVKVMKAQGRGRIINTASNQWRNPEGHVNYSGAKGGIVSLTWGLAWELQNTPITCNAIAPFADTRMHESSAPRREELVKAGLMRGERFDQVQDRPAPEFVAPMVVYLASDNAAKITGQIFRCGAGKVAVYSHPSEIKGIYKNFKRDGAWTQDELKDLVPGSLMAGVRPWWG